MNEQTVRAVREWVWLNGMDVERTARWMARTLRVGSLSECRALVVEALA